MLADDLRALTAASQSTKAAVRQTAIDQTKAALIEQLADQMKDAAKKEENSINYTYNPGDNGFDTPGEEEIRDAVLAHFTGEGISNNGGVSAEGSDVISYTLSW